MPAARTAARRLLAAACALAATGVLSAEDDRDAVMFQAWLPSHQAEVRAFEAFLTREQVAGVVPTW
ncbi:MAG TPA: hypothetical protein VIL30_18580, partial [Ramlibacter sp.]